MTCDRVMGSALAALLLTSSVPLAQGAEAGGSAQFTVGRYLDLQSADAPRISPDGTQVIYTRNRVNTQDDEQETSVWIVDADGQHHRFLAKGSGAVWAPDGKSIAYVAEGRPKGKQIFVLHLTVPGPASQLTTLEQDPADLHWSADGRLIGFTMMVPRPEEWSIDLPKAPDGAKWAATPRYTERLHYRRDGVGLTERGFRHLFIVAADGGAPRQVTKGDWSIGESVYEYVNAVDWNFTPDGRSAIVEGYREGDPDHNDQDCYIYSVDLASGATRRLTTTTGGWRRPAVSPDGKTIAYVGFTKNTASYKVADLWTMSIDGSHATLRSKGFDREPQSLEWAPDGSALYFIAEDRGSVRLYSWSARAGIQPLTSGAQVILNPSAAHGTVAVVQSDFRSPPDIELIDPRRPQAARKLTHLNEEVLHGMALSNAEEIQVDSTGGARIQGWIVKPPGFDSSQRYPLLLEIHGGPYAMYSVAFNPSFQNFAANGYVMLFINPRGSTGYGRAFSDAIAKHYPGPDYDDLMASVDAVIKQGYIDTGRMFVAGCSGGGILSSWVIGHTDRFAAAAVRCPVTDWMSLAGETDMPFYTYSFFKKPFWEDPSDWLEQSTLMHVGNIKTPTLLMTGELDRRTPIPQTEELYTALRYRGIPAALLRFDGEFHGTDRKPSNWMRTQLYMMSWFERYGAKMPAAPR
ncbi:MAG TPA: S9 family peptidase [Steroidobacteraceae bacterium]|nr:S9 family peptidase [Steroidobacteraceae bacterium]